MSVITKKISSGIYLSEDILNQAGISGEVEIEILDKLIKIYPSNQNESYASLNRDSPIWNHIRMENPRD